MLDKDKLILVFYINVDSIAFGDIYDYLKEARNSFTNSLDDSIISYFIPIKGENSRIECINPSLIDEDEYESNKKKLENAIKNLENFFNK